MLSGALAKTCRESIGKWVVKLGKTRSPFTEYSMAGLMGKVEKYCLCLFTFQVLRSKCILNSKKISRIQRRLVVFAFLQYFLGVGRSIPLLPPWSCVTSGSLGPCFWF